MVDATVTYSTLVVRLLKRPVSIFATNNARAIPRLNDTTALVEGDGVARRHPLFVHRLRANSLLSNRLPL
jgi:hypothetical protein